MSLSYRSFFQNCFGVINLFEILELLFNYICREIVVCGRSEHFLWHAACGCGWGGGGGLFLGKRGRGKTRAGHARRLVGEHLCGKLAFLCETIRQSINMYI